MSAAGGAEIETSPARICSPCSLSPVENCLKFECSVVEAILLLVEGTHCSSKPVALHTFDPTFIGRPVLLLLPSIACADDLEGDTERRVWSGCIILLDGKCARLPLFPSECAWMLV
eukprot:819554-Pelagomonas_calceolata.AAC.2